MAASRRAPSFPLPLPLLLGFLAGRGSGSSSSHSLRYFCTAVSDPGQQAPQFFSVGYVDGQQFISYDAKAKRCIPTVPWIRKVEKEDPHYWERNSQHVRNSELTFLVDLGIVAGYYNRSGGTHTWQWMVGCELRGGSKGGYEQYAYDGQDYISFDKETLTWTAVDVPAQNSKRKWEADPAIARYWKAYLEDECIGWLQRYLEYGKETLLRTGGWILFQMKQPPNMEPPFPFQPELIRSTLSAFLLNGQILPEKVPEVKVTRKVEYDGMETLICHVGGFYPKEIDITWTKDGEVWMQDTYHGLVSPNADGTYYTWWSIMVDPKKREHYKCHVEHDGLLKPVDMSWEEHVSPSTYNLWMIIVCVVVGVLVVLAVGIAVYCKKQQNGFKAISVSDQGSNSSGTESAVSI